MIKIRAKELCVALRPTEPVDPPKIGRIKNNSEYFNYEKPHSNSCCSQLSYIKLDINIRSSGNIGSTLSDEQLSVMVAE